MKNTLTVVGGGLAGSEAAWQAAQRGLDVRLYEMRPEVTTGAHQTGSLAELVCSNSLGSYLPDRATGVLMSEIRQLGSLLLSCAEANSVPAGGALAVDRLAFADSVSERIANHARIQVVREEVKEIPQGPAILATGPLTAPHFSEAISRLTGEQHMYFFDAISPIVEVDSLDMTVAFRASRYGRGQMEDGDYINCPLDREAYDAFVEALLKAERIPLRSFESAVEAGVKAGMHRYFEGCLPIEVIASRGHNALAFGPMRPVGLQNPHTGKRPYAVLQLRQDNLVGTLYNLVGFQTNLTYGEQRRIFRMIPGLTNARFARYGQMHRNTFINAPQLLYPTLQYRYREDLFFAGQITGIEGYMGNIASGLLAGINAARRLLGQGQFELPRATMLGSLCHYITHADLKDFQPMKANFGILPALEDGVRRNRRERARAYAARSQAVLGKFMEERRFNAYSH